MVAVELFEHRLAAVGFNWTDDYSDKLVADSRRSPCTRCGKRFPRITPAMFPSGVGKVGYTIALPDCEAFPR